MHYFEEESGKIKYKGRFAEGRPDGDGELFELNGRLIYRGGVHNWLKHGKGTLFYPNGDVHMEG